MKVWVPLLACPLLLGGSLPEGGDPRPGETAAAHQSSKRKWKPDRRHLKAEGGEGTDKALRLALTWLVEHQAEDGRWSSAGFGETCRKRNKTPCDGAGLPTHDVGITGLALLALTGVDSSVTEGEFQDEVRAGVEWLVAQQKASGLIGGEESHDFFYDHLVATYALCEALQRVDDEALRGSAQAAVDYIVQAQNPASGWRYDVPPIGDADTSVTAWAISALCAARIEGFEVPPEALADGLAWIADCTGESGLVGYDGPSTLSSRTPANAMYERELGEALTAAGMWCRYLAGELGDEGLLDKQAARLLDLRPRWRTDVPANDMYYWYYGTYAMYQRGGNEWKRWNDALKQAVLESQHKRGELKGSWDPVGPWGYSGGRVYSTALMALCLEVYYRFPRYG